MKKPTYLVDEVKLVINFLSLRSLTTYRLSTFIFGFFFSSLIIFLKTKLLRNN